MCSIFSYPYYTKIYVKKLPDNMVFTPFLPTSHHSNPLRNVVMNLLYGIQSTRTSLSLNRWPTDPQPKN